jgi:GNAT superfamily N-acetyltransferase
MAQNENLVTVYMSRENLRSIPDHPLPEPYSIRWYRPGDERDWTRIWQAAEKYSTITPEVFQREFGTDADVLARRMCFVCDVGGKAIGTSTAWFDNDYHHRVYGRIHWVAIVPQLQGKGLGKAMLSATCQRMVELGHDRCYLVTQSPRLAAIRMYLSFGFVPEIKSEPEIAAWRDVLAKLGVDIPLS